MPTSIFDPAVQQVLDQARLGAGQLFPSPADWRDQWIYFLMVDRFNNGAAPPHNLPFDAEYGKFQGGTLEGIRAKLSYLQQLGVGALWLSPVLKNCAFDTGAYHGYGIQNFLAVEPRFGSTPGSAEAELIQLVAEAHQRGIYVILDIVLHHAGNVFAYAAAGGPRDSIGWQNNPATILWRNVDGTPNPAWTDAPSNPPLDAAVWPTELLLNTAFTRQGDSQEGAEPSGDFFSLKGFSSDIWESGLQPVHIALIRCYQYAIARFDIDGFRIDTLKYISPDFERIFANAMREFALSAGKKNFFTFGEIWDDEQKIAQFVGRNTQDPNAVVGVDAALDYPLFDVLVPALKGLGVAPASVANVFETRKTVEENVLTSHGEAGKYFVTFLDNHDQPQRFGYTGDIQLIDQISLGMACLLSLEGVPCVYYGTEQGLQGHKDATHEDDSMVREALWGKPGVGGAANGFAETHPLYLALQAIAAVRAATPALRYGRQYFRPLSGDGISYGLSPYPTGVLAFSRILDDREVVIVANTSTTAGFTGCVIVDHELNPIGAAYNVLYSNKAGAGGGAAPGPVQDRAAGTVSVIEVDGSTTNGPLRVLPITLAATEAQVVGRR